MENRLKRSWFCQCGWTWDEEVGKWLPQEGTHGMSVRYCGGCHQRIEMEWRVIENTDPEDELEEASELCLYCEQLKEADEVDEIGNFAYPVCEECVQKFSSEADGVEADLDAQDPKWGRNKV